MYKYQRYQRYGTVNGQPLSGRGVVDPRMGQLSAPGVVDPRRPAFVEHQEIPPGGPPRRQDEEDEDEDLFGDSPIIKMIMKMFGMRQPTDDDMARTHFAGAPRNAMDFKADQNRSNSYAQTRVNNYLQGGRFKPSAADLKLVKMSEADLDRRKANMDQRKGNMLANRTERHSERLSAKYGNDPSPMQKARLEELKRKARRFKRDFSGGV